jgi:hypothetical protein
VISQPLEYETQLTYSWLAFLVDDQESVDRIRSVVRAVNSLDVPLDGYDSLDLEGVGPSRADSVASSPTARRQGAQAASWPSTVLVEH